MLITLILMTALKNEGLQILDEVGGGGCWWGWVEVL